jgi:alkyl sulfatase BDS1-like metallo-beta-lactamase superfamily hydrolase
VLFRVTRHLNNTQRLQGNIHYGVLTDKEGVDAPLLPMGIDFGAENGYMEPTQTMEDGEKITIGGLEIQAFYHITDTKDTLTFYIPEYSMVIDNVVWPVVNMYTLRGDAYRAPETWLNALRDIRDLDVDFVLTVGGGSKVLYGSDNIRETINATLDAQTFTYDQAIRLTNLGVQPDQLVHHMPMPAELMTHPYVNNAYGQFDTYPASFAVRNHGPFSGNPEDIHNLPKQLQAEYTIKLAGGFDNVYKAWEEAMENAEYLWAKELSATLYYYAPDDQIARQAHADSLRKLGQYSEGGIVRQFYIAGAKSLETADPKYTLSSTPSAEWVATDPVTATNYLRTRINPTKAAGVNGKLAFSVDGRVAQLEIRNSIAEFKASIDDDAVILKVSGEDYGKYYTGKLKAKDIASGKALELLEVFDEYTPVTMFPTSFDHLK